MVTIQNETINVFTDANGQRYGLIIGTKGYIHTERDFTHYVYTNLEQTAEFLANKESATPVRVCEFGHYWGIKDRVRENYEWLLESMAEIGADAIAMPKWPTREQLRVMAQG